MRFIHPLVIALYVSLPLGAAAIAVWRARRMGSRKPIVACLFTCLSAVLLGTAINIVYAHATASSVQVLQILITCYFVAALLFLLKGLSWGLKEGADFLFRLRSPATLAGPHGKTWMLRALGAVFVRVLVLFGLGLPYMLAVGMVFRPKVVSDDDPRKQLGVAYETVSFDSTDGIRLAGWWIPAPPPRPARSGNPIADWGRRTVILCHGLGANKANQLALVRDLIPNGYNVLTFDFRAHGQSGGQLASFGDRERADVLGAVRWVREHRAAESNRLFGLGISMGGAALLAAAGDDSPEGRAFDAVTVYSSYDDFPLLAEDLALNMQVPMMPWIARHIVVPIMSVHVGSDLMAFSPAALSDRVAPRPLLLLHGRGDTLIPFATGVRLYERASQPKLRLWIGEMKNSPDSAERGWVVRTNPRYVRNAEGKRIITQPSGPPADHNNVIYDDEAVRAVRLFFEYTRTSM